MAEPYCEPADIKNAITDTDWGTDYEAILHSLSIRASRLIDNLTGKRPGAYKLIADETIYLTGDMSTSLWVELAQAPTEVAVDEVGDRVTYTVWANTEYLLWPVNAVLMGEPYRRLDLWDYSTKLFWPKWTDCIKITGRMGYSITPPDDVVEATIIQASRWFKRGQQAFRDTGAIVELGKLLYTQALDPDVAEIVAHYTRITI